MPHVLFDWVGRVTGDDINSCVDLQYCMNPKSFVPPSPIILLYSESVLKK